MPEFKGDEVKTADMMMASAILGDESDDIAMQLFKPVKDLNPDEFKELQDEIDRLMNKFDHKNLGRYHDGRLWL